MVYIIYLFISRNWLMQLCGLASLKFVGQACRLATFRQQLILEAEFLLPQGNLTFLLKVFQMIG